MTNPGPFHGCLRRLALAVLIPAVFFLLVEIGFRLAGHKPRGAYLKDVAKLEVLDQFQVSDDGIYRANPAFAWSNGETINQDGFRGRPFDSTEAGRRVAVIGDSFGWGHAAKPISNSFADLLDADPRYTVFNLSIPGTGPDQYALVARKYVPVIHPDVVVLAMYMGNDINLSMASTHLEFKDPALKRWYVTNAGIFGAVDRNGHLLSAEAAYAQARTLPLRVVNFLRSTASGTQLVNWLYDSAYRSRAPTPEKRRALNGEFIECLEAIARACEEHGARFIVAPIPVNPQMENTRNSIRDNRVLFEGFDTRVIENLAEDDYSPFPDDHFNNAGHRKMADFLRGVLESVERPPDT